MKKRERDDKGRFVWIDKEPVHATEVATEIIYPIRYHTKTRRHNYATMKKTIVGLIYYTREGDIIQLAGNVRGIVDYTRIEHPVEENYNMLVRKIVMKPRMARHLSEITEFIELLLTIGYEKVVTQRGEIP